MECCPFRFAEGRWEAVSRGWDGEPEWMRLRIGGSVDLVQFGTEDVVLSVANEKLKLVRLSSGSELIHFYELKGHELALQFATRDAASDASKLLLATTTATTTTTKEHTRPPRPPSSQRREDRDDHQDDDDDDDDQDDSDSFSEDALSDSKREFSLYCGSEDDESFAPFKTDVFTTEILNESLASPPREPPTSQTYSGKTTTVLSRGRSFHHPRSFFSKRTDSELRNNFSSSSSSSFHVRGKRDSPTTTTKKKFFFGTKKPPLLKSVSEKKLSVDHETQKAPRHPWLRTLSQMKTPVGGGGGPSPSALLLRKAKSTTTMMSESEEPPPLPPRHRRSNTMPSGEMAKTIQKLKDDEAAWATLVDFVPVKIIGRGAFSTVLLVRKERGGTDVGATYAMKVMTKSHILKEGLKESLLVEREVLRVVRHPFLVELRYAMHTKERLFLVTDFFAGGSLVDSLRHNGNIGLGVEIAKFLVAELALGLAHLHSNSILHRDVKPANVLLDAAGHAHLADYGLAKIVRAETLAKTTDPRRRRRRSFAGTLDYMSPELLKKEFADVGEDQLYAADWWALGVVLVEIAHGATPFAASSPRELMTNILKNDPKVPSPELQTVTTHGFLVRDPRKRLATLRGVEAHPFFAAIDFSLLASKDLAPPHQPRCISTEPQPEVVKLIFNEYYLSPPPSSSSSSSKNADDNNAKDPPPSTTPPPHDDKDKDKDDDGLPRPPPRQLQRSPSLDDNGDDNDAFRGFSYRWNPR